eukprot:CAMPEP_0179888804 /NCGR_PEP_ID=MMETSP0982-20121206/32176_1 /TAXON_ID=483367 /ORGANISM="non described non described, Strain CCMP 2436" /LENGTH=96 /DNA_ID=CAMNT_0021784809 /DNA_START=98 /DNA_END=385 /DNA_ORIENTATION=+
MVRNRATNSDFDPTVKLNAALRSREFVLAGIGGEDLGGEESGQPPAQQIPALPHLVERAVRARVVQPCAPRGAHRAHVPRRDPPLLQRRREQPRRA